MEHKSKLWKATNTRFSFTIGIKSGDFLWEHIALNTLQLHLSSVTHVMCQEEGEEMKTAGRRRENAEMPFSSD